MSFLHSVHQRLDLKVYWGQGTVSLHIVMLSIDKCIIPKGNVHWLLFASIGVDEFFCTQYIKGQI